MPDRGRRVYGIDLGTTYSAVGFVDETGRAAVARNGEGEETTPSVVYLESPTNVVVGTQAKAIAKIEPDHVVSLVKRQMGTSAVYSFHGQEHTPESLSALILKHLAAGAEVDDEVRDVVITVPAYFGMRERDATRKAGEIAGLEVLGIVPEPVAAAVHYETSQGAVGRTVLVYDLGGGTFDTSVIRIDDNAVDVVCTDGDKDLGGADWDARLAEHLMTRFVEEAAPDEDPRESEDLVQEVALLAESVKKQLSKHESRPVNLKLAGAAARFDVSRAEFEAMTEDLLDTTVAILRRTLDTLEDKSPGTTIDEVLLVGGSTRMPAVAERLAAEFGWTPRLFEPDLAVAKGAAIWALSPAGGAGDRAGPRRRAHPGGRRRAGPRGVVGHRGRDGDERGRPRPPLREVHPQRALEGLRGAAGRRAAPRRPRLRAPPRRRQRSAAHRRPDPRGVHGRRRPAQRGHRPLRAGRDRGQRGDGGQRRGLRRRRPDRGHPAGTRRGAGGHRPRHR